MAMESEFEYYFIKPVITERTPLLMSGGAGPNGIDFLYRDTTVPDGYTAHLRFAMPLKNPDMNTDLLDLEGAGVFSEKVCEALLPRMPIKNLQLVRAVINEKGVEYNGFWIANVYRNYQAFDEKKSIYTKINRRGEWVGVKKIVLDKDLLSQIPLDERLVFEASEDCRFTLYHKSVVEIIKSTDPRGMRFIPVEEWNPGIAFDSFK